MDALSIEEKLIISEPVDSVLVSTIDAALMCKRQEKLVDMPNEQEAMLSMIETSLSVANVKKERYTCDSCGKVCIHCSMKCQKLASILSGVV